MRHAEIVDRFAYDVIPWEVLSALMVVNRISFNKKKRAFEISDVSYNTEKKKLKIENFYYDIVCLFQSFLLVRKIKPGKQTDYHWFVLPLGQYNALIEQSTKR